MLGVSGDEGMEAHIGMVYDVESAAIAAGRADGFKRVGAVWPHILMTVNKNT